MNSNVYVRYDPAGRMGNRMFQLAFGYILSKLKNCSVYHDGLPNFEIKPSIPNALSNTNTAISTREYGYHHVKIYNLIDTQHNVIVNSFLQKAVYYTPHLQCLRELFGIRELEQINKNKLVLHIRETDYTQIGAFLGYDVYKKIIDMSGFTDVIIVTDNSNCETVKKLLADGCVLNTKGYVDKFTTECDERGIYDFSTMLRSENVAISQSSYAWWAAFLGYHKKIIFPFKTELNWWKVTPDKDDIDLYFEIPEVTNKYII
jgi:hypothetical protein